MDLQINFSINEFIVKVVSSSCQHLNLEDAHSDEHKGVIFEMKNFETQLILENEYSDIATDLSI